MPVRCDHKKKLIINLNSHPIWGKKPQMGVNFTLEKIKFEQRFSNAFAIVLFGVCCRSI